MTMQRISNTISSPNIVQNSNNKYPNRINNTDLHWNDRILCAYPHHDGMPDVCTAIITKKSNDLLIGNWVYA